MYLVSCLSRSVCGVRLGILMKHASLVMLKLFIQLNIISGESILSAQRKAVVLHFVKRQLGCIILLFESCCKN